MKTRHGNCGGCPLVDSKKFSDTSFVSNNNNISELDYLIVCDFQKYGESVIDFFKNNLSDVKYGICDRILCDRSEFNNVDLKLCAKNCMMNAVSIKAKCSPKRSFVLDLEYWEDLKNYGFERLCSLEDLKNTLVGSVEETVHNDYYSIKIPEKYYTDEYRLVDIQYMNYHDKLIYIFRNRNNEKEFFEFPSYQNNFYWYEAVTSNKIIDEINKLKLVTGKYKERNQSIRAYGGDIDIATRHSVDYFFNNKGEAPIVRSNIMFFDIETYQYLDKSFPDPDKAKYPITAISFRTDDPKDTVHVYLLNLKGHIDPRVNELIGKFPYITLFDDEATMLRAFFQKLYKSSVDFLAGWNVNGFDIPYIVKRMSNLKINAGELSPYGSVYADKSGRNQIIGYHVMDQLKLFKDLVQQTQPSYSLNAIAASVLGKEKVKHEESIDEMYHNDIEKFMRYSQTDTQLIYEIDQEEGHIGLQDEIRRVCTVSQSGANSTIGCAEGLYATELAKKGQISRNYTHDIVKEKIPGAYVYDSVGGLFVGLLCDFDYKSLYPTTICTWNIGNDSYIAKIDEQTAKSYIFDRNSLRGKTFKITLDPIHANKTITWDLKHLEAFIEKYHANMTIIGTIFCGHDIHTAANVEILTMLMKSRSLYKDKMLTAKEAGDVQQTLAYNNKQLAFKVQANALYGVLGNEHWRFYNPDLGKSITLTGQEMLKYAANRVFNYIKGNIDENIHPIDAAFEKKSEKVNDVIIYGDTDSIMVNLTDYLAKNNISLDDHETVNGKISKLQNFYNKIALPQLLECHGINLKKSMMYLKNEFLFSRYYSLEGAKHYASKVISQEGRNVSYTDIKGLEIKRSEIPLASQKLLQEIVDTIMNESIQKCDLKTHLDEVVNRHRCEMVKLLEKRDSSMARVASFSRELEDYKADRIPFQVKAMLIWNDLMGTEDFKHGTKGKYWKILGIDIDKAPEDVRKNYYDVFLKKYNLKDLKDVCTPEDVETLPDYFILDSKSMMKYACDDRVSNLLNPLWKESENDSDLLF